MDTGVKAARCALVAAGCMLGCTSAVAQNYPDRPVRLIVPFSAGGASDIVARIVQPGLSQALGQQVVIDNRGGAAGTIGTGMAAKAAPDGYTLVLVPSSHAINHSLYAKLPFHSVRSFETVILLDSAPLVVAVHPSLPVKSVKEMIALAKSKPGELTYPSGGVGSGSHLGGELFAASAGVQMQHVPYKGLGPSIVDLLAGRRHLVFSPPLPVMPHIRQGRLRAIGHTGPGPSKNMPDLQPVSEIVPGYYAISWHGILAPAGTDAAVIKRLNAELDRILATPQIAKSLSDQGLEPGGGSPERFSKLIANDIERFEKVISRLGLRADKL